MLTVVIASYVVLAITIVLLLWKLKTSADESVAPALGLLSGRIELVRSALEEKLATAMADTAGRLERTTGSLRQDLADRLDGMFRLVKETVENQLAAGRSEQTSSMRQTTVGLETKFSNLQESTQRKLDDVSKTLGDAFGQLRKEQGEKLDHNANTLSESATA